METHGTKEYRQHMAAIHEHVARTGESVTITKDGVPYVKVVAASEAGVLERLAAQGLVSRPQAVRAPIEPVDAGGDDSTPVISEGRR